MSSRTWSNYSYPRQGSEWEQPVLKPKYPGSELGRWNDSTVQISPSNTGASVEKWNAKAQSMGSGWQTRKENCLIFQHQRQAEEMRKTKTPQRQHSKCRDRKFITKMWLKRGFHRRALKDPEIFSLCCTTSKHNCYISSSAFWPPANMIPAGLYRQSQKQC